MINIDELSVRELQKEAARALTIDAKGNNELAKFNKLAHHNSHLFYKAVINDYIEKWGDLPSKVGPGKEIRLIYEKD